jgi:hypothetical protein
VTIRVEVVPIDLVTEWRRCGIVSDFAAAYLEWAFTRRSAARSVLSTVVNELVENAAKFSVDNRVHTDVTIRFYGELLHAEVHNHASEEHVARLAEVLDDLARSTPEDVFRRRLEGRVGLGLALIARDYRATVGAQVGPGRTPGERTVCLRVALNAREVEQP